MPSFIRPALFAAAVSLVSLPAMAQTSPVLGSWDTRAVTDFGTFESKLTITATDDGYAVDMVDAPMAGAGGDMPPMESTFSNVTVDGASFAFTRNLTSPMGPMALAYRGTVEGDRLTGNADSDFGAIPIIGTRAAD